MRKLKFILLFVLLVLVTGCVKGTETVPDYNLTLVSPDFNEMYEYYSSYDSDTDRYVSCYAIDFHDYIEATTVDSIHSLTVCDDTITDEVVMEIIDCCKASDIPVFFTFIDISDELLAEYDKAYCIDADYRYFGEQFAVLINSEWTETLNDRNSDQILTYSVITPETFTAKQQDFYDGLMTNIKLLGIPLTLNEEIYLSKGDVKEYCTDNRKANECFVILESSYLSVFCDEYEFYGEGVEIIGMDFYSSDRYADIPQIQVCLENFTSYIDIRNEILSNIDGKIYPFENINYYINNKTIYIEPEF